MILRCIGIDPGKTGAIACVEGEELRWVADMPLADGHVAPALLDQLYLPDEFGPWEMHAGNPVAIELVHAMPGEGGKFAFTFGRSYGVLLGYFAANHHRILHVPPTEWKKTFRLNGKDKDAARALAIELWPHMASYFARKKDQGRADAALIALYHARTIARHTGGQAA